MQDIHDTHDILDYLTCKVLMNYQHRFIVQQPQQWVVAFHRQAKSMPAITPPPIVVQGHKIPKTPLNSGDEMEFTLWIGPLPIHWVARIENLSAEGFTDHQLHGPFKQWSHQHRFIALDEQRTEVIDEIEATLYPHGLNWWLGWLMWLGLPILFAFRAWKSRCLLERTPSLHTLLN